MTSISLIKMYHRPHYQTSTDYVFSSTSVLIKLQENKVFMFTTIIRGNGSRKSTNESFVHLQSVKFQLRLNIVLLEKLTYLLFVKNCVKLPSPKLSFDKEI